MKKYTVNTRLADFTGTLGETLITPTRIYTRAIVNALAAGASIKGIVHITGGGFYENIPRILPDNTAVRIDRKSFDIPVIFQVIQREGEVADQEMFTTFNMGIGLMIFSAPEKADSLMSVLRAEGESPRVIGEVVSRQNEPVIIL